MRPPSSAVARGDVWLSPRVWALIVDAARAAGIDTPHVVQGSWSAGTLSAGTHSGGGAFDLRVRGLSTEQRLALVRELRARNCAAWLRSVEFGWRKGDHIHGVVCDEPGLHVAARAQVRAYRAGRNGLANGRRDPHPRPATIVPFRVVARSNLRHGLRNPDVRDLQAALGGGLKVDGRYGPRTDAAVRAHQQHLRIPVDPAGRSNVGPVQAEHLGLRMI